MSGQPVDNGPLLWLGATCLILITLNLCWKRLTAGGWRVLAAWGMDRGVDLGQWARELAGDVFWRCAEVFGWRRPSPPPPDPPAAPAKAQRRADVMESWGSISYEDPIPLNQDDTDETGHDGVTPNQDESGAFDSFTDTVEPAEEPAEERGPGQTFGAWLAESVARGDRYSVQLRTLRMTYPEVSKSTFDRARRAEKSRREGLDEQSAAE